MKLCNFAQHISVLHDIFIATKCIENVAKENFKLTH